MCKKRQVIMLLAGVLLYSSAIANETSLPTLSDKQARQLKAQLNLKAKNKTLNRLVGLRRMLCGNCGVKLFRRDC